VNSYVRITMGCVHARKAIAVTRKKRTRWGRDMK
jgi:hypothetical protein